MAKLNLRIKPLFVLYVFLCVYFGWFNCIFYYIVTVFLHECGHYFCAKKLGYDVNGLVFSVYGMGMYTNNNYTKKDDIIISLFGPIVNLVLIIFTICLWWLYPISYYYTKEFLVSNLSIMIFNLLPIYPLDGGRILIAFLSNKFNRNHLMKVSSIICFCVGILMIVLFILSCFFCVNYNLVFIGIFLCFNSIVGDKFYYYERIKSYDSNNKNSIEIKLFRFLQFDKTKMLKCISPHYFARFEYISNGEICYIDEDELLKK